MSQDKQSVFLEQRTYRRRRLADGARMLPIFGAVLLCLPLLWTLSDGAATSTTFVMTFLFIVWVGLIAVAALVSSRLRADDDDLTTLKDE